MKYFQKLFQKLFANRTESENKLDVFSNPCIHNYDDIINNKKRVGSLGSLEDLRKFFKRSKETNITFDTNSVGGVVNAPDQMFMELYQKHSYHQKKYNRKYLMKIQLI